MTINTTQLRAFIGPVWQEISSLWSGVDFSFSDSWPDPAEHPEQALFVGTMTGDPQSGIDGRLYQHCW
ncbi:MAG TPA: hypothetical protein VGI32_04570 [Steroidobacteraceae bacterium]|jgi:hypothetical protein